MEAYSTLKTYQEYQINMKSIQPDSKECLQQ